MPKTYCVLGLLIGIQTALRQNPTLLNAIQEIERTKGVIIEIRAQAWHIYS